MVIIMVNICDDDCYLVMKVISVKEVMSCDVSPVVMFFVNSFFGFTLRFRGGLWARDGRDHCQPLYTWNEAENNDYTWIIPGGGEKLILL